MNMLGRYKLKSEDKKYRTSLKNVKSEEGR